MSVQDKVEAKPNELALLLLFIFVDVASFILLMFGSSMIGDAFSNRSLAYGVQLMGIALLLPIIWLFGAALFNQK
jgi:hypothetical protein